MKYVVSWETTHKCVVVVEANSKEEAEALVIDGKFDKDDLDEDVEFCGVTMVEEVKNA